MKFLHRSTPPFLFFGETRQTGASAARRACFVFGLRFRENPCRISASTLFFPCFLRNGRERTSSTLFPLSPYPPLPLYPSTPPGHTAGHTAGHRSKQSFATGKIRGVPLTTPLLLKVTSGRMPSNSPKKLRKSEAVCLCKNFCLPFKRRHTGTLPDRLFL